MNAYDGIKILLDICILNLKIFFYIFEGIYRLIVPIEEKSVAGEIVLITGAGHGIGRELALKYASLGAKVVCCDVNPQGNQETLELIKKLGATSAYAYSCDVAQRDEVFEVAKKIQHDVGHPTILVNNAGIMPCQKFFDYTPETIRKIFDVNVLSHLWLLQAFLPAMIAKNHGHVVALSSVAGIIGLINLVPYCASKFAVRGLMEAMIDEMSNHISEPECNVKFTTIYPYMVDTGLCKNPRIKFPNFMGLVTPKEAAAQIITAQRRNYVEASIPRPWLSINAALRNFPDKAGSDVRKFLNSGVDAEN